VTDMRVTVCPKCKGEGKEFEQYEFRVIESTCQECMGEGCLVPGGPKDPEPTSAPSSSQPRREEEDMSPEAVAARREKMEAKCRRDAEKLRARVARYEAEREALQAATLETTLGEKDKKAAQIALVNEIDKQLGNLRTQLEKREGLIQAYEKARGEGSA